MYKFKVRSKEKLKSFTLLKYHQHELNRSKTISFKPLICAYIYLYTFWTNFVYYAPVPPIFEGVLIMSGEAL